MALHARRDLDGNAAVGLGGAARPRGQATRAGPRVLTARCGTWRTSSCSPACLVAALWLEPVLRSDVFRRWRRLLLTCCRWSWSSSLWDLRRSRPATGTSTRRRRPASCCRRAAARRGAVLPGRAGLRGARLRSGPGGRCAVRRATSDLHGGGLLGVRRGGVDLFVLRVRLVGRVVFWATYPIIIFFQLLSNGILTGRTS